MTTKSKITRKEAANILGVATKSIDRYIRRGWLKSEKIGHYIWINTEEIDSIKTRLTNHLSRRENTTKDQNEGLGSIVDNPMVDTGHVVDTTTNMASFSQISSRQREGEGSENQFSSHNPQFSKENPKEGSSNSMTNDKLLITNKNKDSSEGANPYSHREQSESDEQSRKENIESKYHTEGVPTCRDRQEHGFISRKIEFQNNKENEFLQALIKDLRAELKKKDEQITSAAFQVGELKAKLDSMVPLLEFQNKEKLLETSQVEIKNKTNQIIDISQKLNIAKVEISNKTSQMENKTTEFKNKLSEINNENEEIKNHLGTEQMEKNILLGTTFLLSISGIIFWVFGVV